MSIVRRTSAVRRGGFVWGLAFVLTQAWPSPCEAYRPLATEDAGVAGKGVAQVEVSVDAIRWANRDEEALGLVVPVYGVTERVECSVEIPYMVHRPADGSNADGWGDANLVGKFLWLTESDRRPAVALKGAVKTETGDEDAGHGSGALDASLVLVGSKRAGRLTGHAMAGYTWVGQNGEDDAKDLLLYGLAADLTVAPAWHLVAEIAGFGHPDRTMDKHPAAGLLGVTYQASERVTFDSSVKIGLTDPAPDWTLSLGMTVTFS